MSITLTQLNETANRQDFTFSCFFTGGCLIKPRTVTSSCSLQKIYRKCNKRTPCENNTTTSNQHEKLCVLQLHTAREHPLFFARVVAYASNVRADDLAQRACATQQQQPSLRELRRVFCWWATQTKVLRGPGLGSKGGACGLRKTPIRSHGSWLDFGMYYICLSPVCLCECLRPVCCFWPRIGRFSTNDMRICNYKGPQEGLCFPAQRSYQPAEFWTCNF